jgi:Siphovirus ReqiPepy6 Gp37-like protein
VSRSIEIVAYNRDLEQPLPVGGFVEAEITQRFNAPGRASFSLPANHHRVIALTEPGARVRMDAEGMALSGPIKSWTSKGPAARALVTFEVGDDFELFKDFLCWVVPGSPITAQGTAGVNDTRTGPAETVIKAYAQANAVARLGLPVTIPASLGRGPTITLQMRFYTLYDKVFPVEDGLGFENGALGFSILQQGGSLVLDCYSTKTYAPMLSESAGTISEWEITSTAATATDVVIGGQGEGQLRLLRTVSDPVRIVETGRRMERWRDSSDSNDPNTLYARGNETLDEGRAKAGIKVTLAESVSFKYGVGAAPRVGDRVTVEVAPGVTLGPEILRECTIKQTPSTGYVVAPSVGDRPEEPGLVKAVRDIVRYLRRVNA